MNSRDGSLTIADWGASFLNDVLVPADYDGDGEADIAVWRPGEGNWYIKRSSDGVVTTTQWGLGTAPYNDIPVPGDYDGDGEADIAVWRPWDGHWYILNSHEGPTIITNWIAGDFNKDVPVTADYDGDGKADPAVWRPGDGNWHIRNSSDGSLTVTRWGAGYAPYNDKPVAGDYDGDGKVDIAVWRPGDGNWYILNSRDGSVTVTAWGAGYLNDIPVVAPAMQFGYPLTAPAPSPEPVGIQSSLTSFDLAPLIQEGIIRWSDALQGGAGDLTVLSDVTFRIADLPGLTLAKTVGNTILIDADAAGYGWFIDPTPLDNREFKGNPKNGKLAAMGSSPASGDMDLLTVVMHEFGHVLGFDDLTSARGEDSLMGATLEAGTRYLPGNGHNGNDNGTSKFQAANEQDSALVAMEARFDSLFGKRKVNQNSWLASYLLNGGQDSFNPFGINGDIQILLDPKNNKNNKGIAKGL